MMVVGEGGNKPLLDPFKLAQIKNGGKNKRNADLPGSDPTLINVDMQSSPHTLDIKASFDTSLAEVEAKGTMKSKDWKTQDPNRHAKRDIATSAMANN